jgi:hypothetical protein
MMLWNIDSMFAGEVRSSPAMAPPPVAQRCQLPSNPSRSSQIQRPKSDDTLSPSRFYKSIPRLSSFYARRPCPDFNYFYSENQIHLFTKVPLILF